jgi:large subunit ribosomal protein L24e
MPACSFCHANYEVPRGTTVVQKDGSIKTFCSSKCRKNFAMGRDNKKLTWIKKMPENKAEAAKKAEAKVKLAADKVIQDKATEVKKAASRVRKK